MTNPGKSVFPFFHVDIQVLSKDKEFPLLVQKNVKTYYVRTNREEGSHSSNWNESRDVASLPSSLHSAGQGCDWRRGGCAPPW